MYFSNPATDHGSGIEAEDDDMSEFDEYANLCADEAFTSESETDDELNSEIHDEKF